MRSARWIFLILTVCVTVSAAAQTGKQATASSSTRRYINRPNRSVQGPFSEAVLVGDTLYIGGRLGVDPATGKPPEDLEQEARFLLDGLKAVLNEAGMNMDDLVFVQVFCPDLSLYDKFNSVYKNYFSKDYPARAFLSAGIVLRGAHFEMNAIAVKR